MSDIAIFFTGDLDHLKNPGSYVEENLFATQSATDLEDDCNNSIEAELLQLFREISTGCPLALRSHGDHVCRQCWKSFCAFAMVTFS